MFLRSSKGMTLVEAVIASAVFLVIALGIYEGLAAVSRIIKVSRLEATALTVALDKLELARHLPFADLGVIGGWPAGKLPAEENVLRGGVVWKVTNTVRQIDDPFDGTVGGNPNDLSPADYKLAETIVSCESCGIAPVALTTQVAPLAEELDAHTGAISIQTIDSNGIPVQGANVTVENGSHLPPIVINDVTGADGTLRLVDMPPGELAYKIVVAKSGYSGEETYAPGESGITNPIKPNVTVAEGQITPITFSIDRLSDVTVKSVDSACGALGPFEFKLTGAKLLGQNPNVYKYEETLATDGAGLLSLAGLEWDNYAFLPLSDAYHVIGSFPLLSAPVTAGLNQQVSLVIALKQPPALLLTVKDASTGLPLDGAEITISADGYEEQKITNRGYLRTTDWSSGGSSLGVEVNDPAGEIKLARVFENYVAEGYWESGVFDAGQATTTYRALSWQPATQPIAAGENSIRVQLASSDEPDGPWTFAGPDGGSGTFYTESGSELSSVHENDRYLKYRLYLQTADTSTTPLMADLSITYSSVCLPFGQVYFGNLPLGLYNVSIARDGYQELGGEVNVVDDWQSFEAILVSN